MKKSKIVNAKINSQGRRELSNKMVKGQKGINIKPTMRNLFPKVTKSKAGVHYTKYL